MFGLGKLFGKAKAEAIKFDKRDMAEATVAGAILVMAADGEIEESEMTTLQGIISVHPAFQAFGSEIHVMVDKFITIMKSGATLGKVMVMDEIRDCQNSEGEKIQIFAILVDVAKADGEIEPSEKAVLKDIAKNLCIPNNYLVEFGIED